MVISYPLERLELEGYAVGGGIDLNPSIRLRTI
jgi:hypothetical protein